MLNSEPKLALESPSSFAHHQSVVVPNILILPSLTVFVWNVKQSEFVSVILATDVFAAPVSFLAVPNLLVSYFKDISNDPIYVSAIAAYST